MGVNLPKFTRESARAGDGGRTVESVKNPGERSPSVV